MRKSPLRKVSKKNWWIPLRAKAKVAFERAGVTTCEVRHKGCWNDNGLGFAHSLRRRYIRTEEDKREVVLCCNYCHLILDSDSHETTAWIVRKIISDRPTPIVIP